MEGVHWAILVHISSDYRPPDWGPLQRALSSEFGDDGMHAAAAFWFIGFIAGPADVGELRLYEHSVTRRRLVLDREGGAFRWFAAFEGYSRITMDEALIDALA